jgi:prepilin-type N-terminal cleavage/methylation domain-containing protein
MSRNEGQSGFGIIELLVATAIIAIVLVMSTDVFTIVLAQSRQQTRVVSSEQQGVAGLRMLQYDVEHAGYGLLGRYQNGINYSEAAAAPASNYNDSPAGIPRAIVKGNNTGFNGSDYLVIKSTVAATSSAAQKWTYIRQGASPKIWDIGKQRLIAGERVIVIKPRSDENSQNELEMDGSTFSTQYNNTFPTAFSPKKTAERFVIYGVDPSTDLRMPFNRADYYVARPGTGMSPSCAPNTGILFKATLQHSDGSLSGLPVLDCVADMQIAFLLDTDSNGATDAATEDISGLTAQQIRETLKEVRVYLLVQEGNRDTSYTHSPATMTVGDTLFGAFRGSNFDLSATIGAGWQNYRWKIYTLVIRSQELQ